MTVNEINELVKLAKNADNKHDFIDSQGNLRIDTETAQTFCWKHLKWE